MSADQHLLVAEFHRAFGHPVALMPTWRDQKTRELRIRLLLEEYDELRAAEAANDRIEIADALADIAYIAHGTMWVHGLPYWANKTFDGTLDEAVEKYRNARKLIEAHLALSVIQVQVRTHADTAGIPFAAVFTEVHASNMSKLGLDGKPIYRADGKILKGPNYFAPDIARILAEVDAA